MAIQCPYCPHTMSVKGPKPGRFKPKCSKCGRQFQLTVAGEGELTFHSEPLEGSRVAVKSAAGFDPNVTAPSVEGSPPGPVKTPQVDDTVAPTDGAPVNADFSVGSLPGNDDTMAAGGGPAPRPPRADATEAEGDSAPAAPQDMPSVLGGYQVVKELGRGGMGAVYLARQVSLDRPVALKVMNPEWASNPNFLVRFTREAYAAAQLVHHNIVQVYDIGQDKGIHYFSMEFVEGQSLGGLLKKEGKLAPDVAAGYALQAARGLQFAHARGMIHRDIKPDNLMLNTQGVVKVADLGLVRTPGMAEEQSTQERAAIDEEALRARASTGRSLASLSGVTMAGQAMGTPAYMAPEQAKDATTCDYRADIYSLGCTLYVLATGSPVFKGATALEVMTRHASDAPQPPHAVDKQVPKALSDIILKMIAKKPEARYQSMDEVVKVLEDFLNLQGAGMQSATEQHLRTLEQGTKAFYGVGLAGIRSWSLLGFFGGCALLTVLTLFAGWWIFSGFFLGLGVMTGLSYFCVHGSMERSYLFRRVRDYLAGCSWSEFGKLAGGALLFLLVLYLLGLLWVFLLTAFLGVGLAFGVYYGLDRPIATSRAEATDKVDRMLKALRLRGLSEEALQEFVAKYAGENWEEFFEALFGYEALLAARLKYGAGPRGPRPQFAWWRDPIVRWLDAMQKARQEAKEKAHLQAVEQKGLEAQGVAAAEAKQRAEQMANAIVEKAAEIKQQEAAVPVAQPAAPAPAVPQADATVAPEQGKPLPVEDRQQRAATPRRASVQDIFKLADAPDEPPKPKPVLEPLLNFLFGGGSRFVVGSLLLFLSLFWMYTQGLLPSSANAGEAGTYQKLWEKYHKAKPFELPGAPPEVMKAVCSVGALAAGVLMVISALWLSWKIGIMQYLAAAVFVAGPVSGLVPEVGPLSPEVACLAAGAVISLLGFLLGRDT